MSNNFRIFIVVIGITLVITTGLIAYYLHNLSVDVRPSSTKQISNELCFDYKCTSFYLFSDGNMHYLDKFIQEGWQVFSFIGPVVRDADRAKGGEGHIYVVLRRPRS